MSDPSLSDQELWRRFKQGSQPASPCPDFNQLAAYADERLQGDELYALERHLAECKLCLDAVRAARTDSSISAATRPSRSSGPLVLPQRRNGRAALAWAGMAAACALVCLAGFEMGKGTVRLPRTNAMVADFSPFGAGE